MNSLDLLLCVTLIIQSNSSVKHIHQKLAKLMKSTPRSLRGSLALFIKSKDPAAMLERVLNDWEAEPIPTVARDPKTGRFFSLKGKR